jgi:hypothetical protein
MVTSKKPDLDDATLRIARTLLNTPPKPHDEMKLGKPTNPKHRNVKDRKPKKAKPSA